MKEPLGKPRKPVILQVLPALETGGLERGTIDMAIAQKEAGYEPLVASNGGMMVRELDRHGIRHITMPLHSKNIFRMRKNATRLVDLIKAEGVDLIHARSRAPAWSAYWAAQRTGIPFVTTFHGTYNFKTPLKKAYNAIMVKSDRVIAISEFIRDHILANYDVDPAKITVIRRGMDLDLFDPQAVPASRVVQLATDWRLPDGVPVVMLSGRLTRWKGQTLLLEAIAKLDRKVRCILVGSDQGREAYREEVEALARKLGIDDKVHVVGNCRDMPAAYKLADVVVSASTDPEAFGRVAVEGQAMGRPVVAPAHGGAVEQIDHGVNGWLFKPGDADDLARQLEAALSLTPEERVAFHERAIENARTRFSKAQMAEKTMALYAEMLARQSKHAPVLPEGALAR
ncbi:glycosyltransferase family 4 protein [Aestuariispira ectoiniformans]|uniref:glycosyltransferase family 4 protein n=1 Tax=Aestuariispira ectoiniformans TaxID=2775080 RepID=UPI00223BFD00|nr:glycosyltransferase family 4 protein [Aestuariispira ectoiniformans]